MLNPLYARYLCSRDSSNQMHFAYTRNDGARARKIGRWLGQLARRTRPKGMPSAKRDHRVSYIQLKPLLTAVLRGYRLSLHIPSTFDFLSYTYKCRNKKYVVCKILVYKIPYRRARAQPLGRVRRASKGILHTSKIRLLARALGLKARPSARDDKVSCIQEIHSINYHLKLALILNNNDNK